jgi:predicted ribosome quality control (RQC) complex YloA/Tae2 family protein
MHRLSMSTVKGTSADRSKERRLLRGVLVEALAAQKRKRTALESQLVRAVPETSAGVAHDEEGDDKAAKQRTKAMRRAEQVPEHLAAVAAAESRLQALLDQVASHGVNFDLVRCDIEEMGLGNRLHTYDVDEVALKSRQWGRPDGFSGLVVESPNGVPILVGQRSFSDPLLRRVGRGSDLFFQVTEGKGSRVLLRTSMRRDLSRSPRECMEMAADLAAFFSDGRRAWYDDDERDVEVMFTDARHVAKRGGRVGQMKGSKKLGTIWARPARVAEVARGLQEEQGWV